MYDASHRINIYTKNQELTFNQGLYHVDIIGGWKIQRNGFILVLINSVTDEMLKPVHPWPVQNLYGFDKGKRIFDFEVPVKGIYRLEFHSPDNLRVTRPILFFGSFFFGLFDRKVNNREITVIIYRK